MIEVGERVFRHRVVGIWGRRPVVTDARNLQSMRGYDAESYGDAFADVYDEWYATVTDVDATVALVERLGGESGRVLELGVGTGRLAIPMARAGLTVTGIDSSAAMLARLASGDPDASVTAVHGDMVDDLPAGRFDVVLAAYNTLFNLVDDGAQERCFAAVAQRLTPDGSFVVEAFVPDPTTGPGSAVGVRSMGVDHVVLSVSRHQPGEQRAEGQFVTLTEAGGVRLRPWMVRWSTPEELDAMAAAAGLALADRWADLSGSPFDDDSVDQVAVYRPVPARSAQPR
jgi:SAM-dependent methyltransferase